MDKYIFCKRKLIDKRACDHLITLFEKSNPQYHPLHDYHVIHPKTTDVKYSFLRLVLETAILEYCLKHPFLGRRPKGVSPKGDEGSWDIDKSFNIQKYDPGHFYDSTHVTPNVEYWDGHCEHGGSEVDCRRMLGWMIYLNDIKHKGGTCWPQQKFTAKPRAGDFYVWPAAWTHSHYGIVAPKETKYIVTGWCSFFPKDFDKFVILT